MKRKIPVLEVEINLTAEELGFVWDMAANALISISSEKKKLHKNSRQRARFEKEEGRWSSILSKVSMTNFGEVSLSMAEGFDVYIKSQNMWYNTVAAKKDSSAKKSSREFAEMEDTERLADSIVDKVIASEAFQNLMPKNLSSDVVLSEQVPLTQVEFLALLDSYTMRAPEEDSKTRSQTITRRRGRDGSAAKGHRLFDGRGVAAGAASSKELQLRVMPATQVMFNFARCSAFPTR